jgi:hypothetical protein
MTTKWTVQTAGKESIQNANRIMIGKPELVKPVE